MKIIEYPSDGIYTFCKENLSYSISEIKKAIEYTNNFSIPSDFKYRSYLYNLGSVLNNYKTEISNIDSVLKMIDDDYESLSERLSEGSRNLETKKIVERERLIK